MPAFLRAIKKARWHAKPEWDGWRDGDIQGDALLDFRTQDNALSVFRVDDGTEIGRIVTALAATKANVSHLDYVVFDDAALASYGVHTVQIDGKTPDSEVNQIHYDVINLTVLKLVRVAQTVSWFKRERVPRIEVKAKLREALENQWLDSERVDSRLLDQLRQNARMGQIP